MALCKLISSSCLDTSCIAHYIQTFIFYTFIENSGSRIECIKHFKIRCCLTETMVTTPKTKACDLNNGERVTKIFSFFSMSNELTF